MLADNVFEWKSMNRSQPSLSERRTLNSSLAESMNSHNRFDLRFVESVCNRIARFKALTGRYYAGHDIKGFPIPPTVKTGGLPWKQES